MGEVDSEVNDSGPPRMLPASLRVLDLSGDDGDQVTRLLADLGADVLKVEPPGGSPSRTAADAARRQPAFRIAQRQLAAPCSIRPTRTTEPVPATAPRKLNRPFDWLRIIDLGIIVACGELSRLYGDLGAEVIKVESTAYPVRAAGHDELRDDTSLHDVYSCAGDDEWCVISIRTDEDWLSATTVFGMPELADDERFAPVRPGWHTGTNWQRT